MPLLGQLHDPLSGLAGDLPLELALGQGRATTDQAQAHPLGQAGHGVRGEQSGARSLPRAGVALDLEHLGLGYLPGRLLPKGLEHRLQVQVSFLPLPRLHRPSGQDDAGDVHPARGHEHAGGDLVAIRHARPKHPCSAPGP